MPTGSDYPGGPGSWDTILDFSKVIIGLGSATVAAMVAVLSSDFSARLMPLAKVGLLIILLLSSIAILASVFVIIRYADLAKKREQKDERNTKTQRVFLRIITNVSFFCFWFLFVIIFLGGVVFWIYPEAIVQPRILESQHPAVASARRHRRYVWTQLMPDQGAPRGGLIVRAIVGPNEPCPSLNSSGQSRPLAKRPNHFPGAFPITVCEDAHFQAGSATLTFADGQRYRLPRRPKPITDLVVVGDTGCRVTFFGAPQHCNHPDKWPFADIARSMQTPRPQLVIHVGDYHYLERSCPQPELCGDGPNGYNWSAWERDFFLPATELLRAAPWIPLRGNHENCSRAGIGWMLFFYPKIGDVGELPCQTVTDAFVYRLAQNHYLIASDAAEAGGTYKPFQTNRETLKRTADRLNGLPGDALVWLSIHRPIWFHPGTATLSTQNLCTQKLSAHLDSLDPRDWATLGVLIDDAKGAGLYCGLRDLILTRPPDGAAISLVLSGDTHLYQLLRAVPAAADARKPWPYQLIAGHGGTSLEDADAYPAFVEGADFVAGYEQDRYTGVGEVAFGYAVFRRADEQSLRQWHVDFRDASGSNVWSDCLIDFDDPNTTMDCER